MGDHYFLEVICPKCKHKNVYYETTCICEKCKYTIDLEKYTGITYEDASNEKELYKIIKKIR